MTVDVSKLSSPAIGRHGGGCCGISHIHGFTSIGGTALPDQETAERRVRFLISKYWHDSNRKLSRDKNRLYEAVLKEHQRMQWEEVLLRIGFEMVTDFTNTNSGNRCYVYHYAMGPKNKHGAYKMAEKPTKKSDIPNPFAPRPTVDIPF